MKPHHANTNQRTRTNACYNCGQSGHIARACTDETRNRMQICWTCGQDDHIRTSRKCPGNPDPENWFCSFCKTRGISTKLCDCNSVNTTRLRLTRTIERNQTSESEEETLVNSETPVKKQKTQHERDTPNYSRMIKGDSPRVRNPIYDWLWAVKVEIDENTYVARITPGRGSFINPERVQIDRAISVPTTIFNRTQNICYTRDTTIATPVTLGTDAITSFGLRAFIGDEQTLPYGKKQPPEGDSDQETNRKTHPNRRLQVEKTSRMK